jgi:hypothetical protein
MQGFERQRTTLILTIGGRREKLRNRNLITSRLNVPYLHSLYTLFSKGGEAKGQHDK